MPRYAELVPEVRRETAEAPTVTIENAIRRAVIEFFRTSRIWRDSMSIDLEAGVDRYRLRVRNEGRAEQVLRVQHENARGGRRELGKLTYQHLLEESGDGQPRYFAETPDGSEIVLRPTPKEPAAGSLGALHVYFTAVPTRRSRSFPDFVDEKYHDALIDGALAIMLGVVDKPWTNFQLADAHRQRFLSVATATARAEAVRDGFTSGRPRPRRWV